MADEQITPSKRAAAVAVAVAVVLGPLWWWALHGMSLHVGLAWMLTDFVLFIPLSWWFLVPAPVDIPYKRCARCHFRFLVPAPEDPNTCYGCRDTSSGSYPEDGA